MVGLHRIRHILKQLGGIQYPMAQPQIAYPDIPGKDASDGGSDGGTSESQMGVAQYKAGIVPDHGGGRGQAASSGTSGVGGDDGSSDSASEQLINEHITRLAAGLKNPYQILQVAPTCDSERAFKAHKELRGLIVNSKNEKTKDALSGKCFRFLPVLELLTLSV